MLFQVKLVDACGAAGIKKSAQENLPMRIDTDKSFRTSMKPWQVF